MRWEVSYRGWTLDDYQRCRELYASVGIDLARARAVGLGSVCRRQRTVEIQRIVDSLAGLRLHGFGVKTGGLLGYGDQLASADSMAWSLRARNSAPLPGHERRHRNCANCLDFALRWRSQLLARPVQLRWAG